MLDLLLHCKNLLFVQNKITEKQNNSKNNFHKMIKTLRNETSKQLVEPTILPASRLNNHFTTIGEKKSEDPKIFSKITDTNSKCVNRVVLSQTNVSKKKDTISF